MKALSESTGVGREGAMGKNLSPHARYASGRGGNLPERLLDRHLPLAGVGAEEEVIVAEPSEAGHFGAQEGQVPEPNALAEDIGHGTGQLLAVSERKRVGRVVFGAPGLHGGADDDPPSVPTTECSPSPPTVRRAPPGITTSAETTFS